jgi:predicted NAD/FAD-binding protein
LAIELKFKILGGKNMSPLNIAVVGSGIGAIASAYDLKKMGHTVSLFEKNDYFGGHTHTHHFDLQGHPYTVDTGFLVHNDRTYPHLIEFFKELQLESVASDMSFSVQVEEEDLEWSGTNLLTVFCQTKNIFRPRFYRFLKEIMRFNKMADQLIIESKNDVGLSLGGILKRHNFGTDFQNWYLLPMGGCIWSTPTHEMLRFPAYTFLKFCKNHGLLQISDRPQWKTVLGGCNSYTLKVVEMLDRTFLNEGVLKVETLAENKGVRLITEKGEYEFDAVFMGTHAPQTRKICGHLDKRIDEVLSKFSYQPNTAFLHTDRNILPKRKSAWSAWNYRSSSKNDHTRAVSVSYLINKLQPLPSNPPIIVTLNPLGPINEEKIIKELCYEHPLFDEKAIRGQAEVPGIQGHHGVYYAGAWMRYGFHEDGIWAAKQALEQFQLDRERLRPAQEKKKEPHAIL